MYKKLRKYYYYYCIFYIKILNFKKKVPYPDNDNQARINLTKNISSTTSLEESNNIENTMFSLVNLSTKNLLTGNNNNNSSNMNNNNNNNNLNNILDNGLDDKKLKRINRGLSAKRYLNNLTKHWDQNVLDTFISDGKIKQETEKTNKNERKSSKRKHIDDDLTVWPQAYRFDTNWNTNGIVDMRSYRFLKAQDFNLTKTSLDSDTKPDTNIKHNSFEEILDKPKKKKSAKDEPIKIFDPRHESEINYKNLATDEKEKVLSELLFQSALENIKQQKESDLDDETISYSVEKNNNKSKINLNDISDSRVQPIEVYFIYCESD